LLKWVRCRLQFLRLLAFSFLFKVELPIIRLLRLKLRLQHWLILQLGLGGRIGR
jgi:hypothetical protein